MTHTFLLAPIAALIVLVAPVVSAESITTKTFSLPGVVEISYPANFVIFSAAQNESAIAFSKQLLNRANLTSLVAFDQIANLHTSYTQENGEYAHVSIALMPPDITQDELMEFDDTLLGTLRDTMAERFKAGLANSAMTILGDFKGEREKLANGIHCFKLTCSYRKSDGSIRVNIKRFIYTSRFLVVVGITTSPGYFNNSKKELDAIVSSIAVSNG